MGPLTPLGRVLVLGVGNPLRGDDGVGAAVVQRLVGRLPAGAVELRTVQQLTPDLAADMAGVELVVIVDAAADLPAGEVRVLLAPADRSGGEPFSHALDPVDLAGLARMLYGAAPRMAMVGVGPASLEPGEGLSPAVGMALESAAHAVELLVGER